VGSNFTKDNLDKNIKNAFFAVFLFILLIGSIIPMAAFADSDEILVNLESKDSQKDSTTYILSGPVSENFQASAQGKFSICSCSLGTNNIILRNTGSAPSTVYLSQKDDGFEGWSSLSETYVDLGIGEQKTVHGFFKVPCSAEGIYNLKTLFTTDFGLEKEINQEVSIKKCSNIDVVSAQNRRVSCPCTPVSFEFVFKNPLNSGETYEFDVEPENEKDAMSGVSLSARYLSLGYGETGKVMVFVNEPCSRYGQFKFNLIASAKSTGYTAKIPFVLDINKCYAYSIQPSQQFGKETAGSSDEFLKEPVFCMDSVNYYKIDLSNKANLANAFQITGSIGSKDYEFGRFTLPPRTTQAVNLKIPVTQSAGTYTLSIKGASERGDVPYESSSIIRVSYCDLQGRPLKEPGPGIKAGIMSDTALFSAGLVFLLLLILLLILLYLVSTKKLKLGKEDYSDKGKIQEYEKEAENEKTGAWETQKPKGSFSSFRDYFKEYGFKGRSKDIEEEMTNKEEGAMRKDRLYEKYIDFDENALRPEYAKPSKRSKLFDFSFLNFSFLKSLFTGKPKEDLGGISLNELKRKIGMQQKRYRPEETAGKKRPLFNFCFLKKLFRKKPSVDMEGLSLDELRKKIDAYKKKDSWMNRLGIETYSDKPGRKKKYADSKYADLGVASYYIPENDDLAKLEQRARDIAKTERKAKKEEAKLIKEQTGVPASLFGQPRKPELWKLLVIVLILLVMIGGLFFIGYLALEKARPDLIGKDISENKEVISEINTSQQAPSAFSDRLAAWLKEIAAGKTADTPAGDVSEISLTEEAGTANESAQETAEEAKEESIYQKTWFKWLAGMILALLIGLMMLGVALLIRRSGKEETQTKLDKFKEEKENKAKERLIESAADRILADERPFYIKPRSRRWAWIKWISIVAAALLLLGLIGFAAYEYSSAKESAAPEETRAAESAADADETAPSDNEAVPPDAEADEADSETGGIRKISDMISVKTDGLELNDEGVIMIKKGETADVPVILANHENSTKSVNLDMEMGWVRADPDNLKIQPNDEGEAVFTINSTDADEGIYRVELEIEDIGTGAVKAESFSFEITGAKQEGAFKRIYAGLKALLLKTAGLPKYAWYAAAAIAGILLIILIFLFAAYRKRSAQSSQLTPEQLKKQQEFDERLRKAAERKARKNMEAEPLPAFAHMPPQAGMHSRPSGLKDSAKSWLSGSRFKRIFWVVLMLVIISGIIFGIAAYSRYYKIDDMEREDIGFIKDESVAIEPAGEEVPREIIVGKIRTLVPLKIINNNENITYSMLIEKNVGWLECENETTVPPKGISYVQLMINPENAAEGRYELNVRVEADNERLFENKLIINVDKNRPLNLLKRYWGYLLAGVAAAALISFLILRYGKDDKWEPEAEDKAERSRTDENKPEEKIESRKGKSPKKDDAEEDSKKEKEKKKSAANSASKNSKKKRTNLELR